MMHIKTKLKVNFETSIEEDFDNYTDDKEINDLIEMRIQMWCDEHKIDRKNVKKIDKESISFRK